MLPAIWTSVKRVSSDYSTWAGAVSAIVAWATDHWGWTTPVPSWAWWMLAVILLFVAAVRSEMAAERAREANRKPSPTVSLMDLLPRIRGTVDIFGPQYSESGKLADALALIREKAMLGEITVFGKTNWRSATPENYKWLPRERISPEYWNTHELDYMEFVQDRRGVITEAN